MQQIGVWVNVLEWQKNVWPKIAIYQYSSFAAHLFAISVWDLPSLRYSVEGPVPHTLGADHALLNFVNDVIELGADFHLEDAGEAADGTQLIAVYRRERRSTRNTTTDSSSTTNPNKKEQ